MRLHDVPQERVLDFYLAWKDSSGTHHSDLRILWGVGYVYYCECSNCYNVLVKHYFASRTGKHIGTICPLCKKNNCPTVPSEFTI